jgi:hypothetical protein
MKLVSRLVINDLFGARGTDGRRSATVRSGNVAIRQCCAYDCPGAKTWWRQVRERVQSAISGPLSPPETTGTLWIEMKSLRFARLRTVGFFFAALFTSSCASASGPAITLPDFTIQVLLSDSATRYLLAHGELVAMSIDFADVVVPAENYLGSIRHEAPGAFLFPVREVKFDPKKIRTLRTKNYEVLVNVFSGRKVLHMNVLDCGFIQDVIENLQRKTHTVRCDLGKWAPR